MQKTKWVWRIAVIAGSLGSTAEISIDAADKIILIQDYILHGFS